LQAGNSLIKFSENSAMIGGAAVSGLIIATWGAQWALIIDSSSFIFCGFLVFTLRHLTTSSGEDETLFSQLVHGWRVFLSFRWIVIVVAGFSFLIMCISGAESVLGPLIALKHFHGAKSWALVLTAESIGFVVGSLIGLRIKVKYQMRFLMILTLSLPVYIFTLAGPLSLWLIALAAFAWGITIDLWGSIWVTALQREVPRESISRVSAFDGMGSLLFKPVGLAIAAPLAAGVGIRTTVIIFGLVALAITLATLFQRDVWRMQLSDNS
jgi:predicted membrane-bound spermidine synthase